MAAQYYDYIDTTKAEEKGIRVKDNYAYNNPALQTGAISTSLDDSQYQDPNTESRKRGKRSSKAKVAKERTAYAPPSLARLEEEPSSTSVPSVSHEAAVYAPPIADLGGGARSQSDDGATPPSSKTGGGKKGWIYDSIEMSTKQVMKKEAKASKKRGSSKKSSKKKGKKGKNEDRQMYAPPLSNVESITLQASGTGFKDDRQTYAPPLLAINSQSNGGAGGGGNQGKDGKGREYAPPLAASMNSGAMGIGNPGEPLDAAGYVGPVVAPPQHTEGIELKDNYAYKIAKKKKKSKKDDNPYDYADSSVAGAGGAVTTKQKKAKSKTKKSLRNSVLFKAYK